MAAPRGSALVRELTKGEHRRALLLSALDNLLTERSLNDISIGDVTSRSGVSRSGFYFYFRTKEAAVAALLDDLYAEIIRDSEAFLAGSDDQRASLVTSLTSLHDIYHAHRHLVLAMADARAVDESARRIWETFIEGFVPRLADRIREDRETAARPGSTPEDLSRVLVWATEIVLERDLRRHPDGGHADRGLLEALVDTYLITLYPRSALDVRHS